MHCPSHLPTPEPARTPSGARLSPVVGVRPSDPDELDEDDDESEDRDEDEDEDGDEEGSWGDPETDQTWDVGARSR